jgi:drug/metabolite transporter (DMT)-like permease
VSWLALFFWLLNVTLDTVGHLAFKAAAIAEHETEWQRWAHMLTRPALWLGIGCFVFEFVAWLALLSLVPLSYAVLIGSINIVAVVVAGRLLFDERLDRMRVAGISLITFGVAMAGALA